MSVTGPPRCAYCGACHCGSPGQGCKERQRIEQETAEAIARWLETMASQTSIAPHRPRQYAEAIRRGDWRPKP
jgi:hypothetical protein